MSHATDLASSLRRIADDIESGALPVPYSVEVSAYWDINDEGHIGEALNAGIARAAMNELPGGWSKRMGTTYVTYAREYGPRAEFVIAIDRSEVCRRVQIGVNHVPAHDEPVYEWNCEPGDG